MTDKLETVGVQHLRAVDGQWHYGEAEYANQEERELVTRSQAEELLAAEREAQQRLLDIIEEDNTDKEALEAQLALFRRPTTAMKAAVSRYTNGSYDLAHAAIEDLVRAALEDRP